MLASMLSPTDSTCYGGGGTDGVSNGESGLDLLRDEDGNFDESSGYQVDNGIGYVVDEQLTSKQFGYEVTQQSHSDPHLMSRHQNPVGSHTNSRKRYRMRYGHGAVIIKGFIVIKSNFMVLFYGMLLTRLYKHVHTTHPFAISDIHYLVDHVMIPLTEGKTRRIMIDGKRPHPQTSSESSSSSSPSPTPNQEEINPVNNFTLDPIAYIEQLPPILRREAPEFKQTKGMFKLFGHFLSNLGKKKYGCAKMTRVPFKWFEFLDVCL
nr:hypothetical protein [Tanacetum cinerariifolium]